MSVWTPSAIGIDPQRLVDAEQAEPAGLLEHLVGGERAGALPLVDVRVDLLLHEIADGSAKL
jgi:hypothetical protein